MNRLLIAVLLVYPALAGAQSRPFETVDEARQRQNAERQRGYEDRGHQAPLGGYRERLGDPAPRSTESPGYVTPPRRDRPDSPSDPVRDRSSASDGYLRPVTPNRR